VDASDLGFPSRFRELFSNLFARILRNIHVRIFPVTRSA